MSDAQSRSLQDNPFYRLGAALSALVDNAIAQALLLLDRAVADPTAFLTAVAAVGIACAAGLWLLGTLFGRLRRPPRPAPEPRSPAPAVIVQAGRPRRTPQRPRRRTRRKSQNPFLRWLGVR